MKRVWIAILVLFTGGSALCGIAPAFWVLIVGRVLQGIGGGMLIPMALGALFRHFPEGERGAAFGLLAIPMVAGPAFGPTLGGYLITYFSWRLVFFINLPIGVLAVVLAALLLRSSQPRTDVRFDTVGAVLSTLAFSGILYGLGRVSQDGWGSLSVRGFLGAGLLSLVAFCAYELTREEPLLDIRLFRLPQFVIANVVFWVGSVAQFGGLFLLPLYLQNLRGLSAFDTGLLLMPQGIAMALSGPIAGRLLDKIGARWVTSVSFVLVAFTTWRLSQITLETSFDTLRWLLVIWGISVMGAAAGPQVVAMSVVPEHLRTNASSLNKATQFVFNGLGVAILATLVQTQAVVHTAVLSWQVRPDTLPGAFLGKVSALLQSYAGLPPTSADTLAVTSIMAQVTRQAAVLAFDDGFRISFVVALLTILLAVLLPGRAAAKVGRAAMVAA
jgi:EmrB/QacA subfamily drug resistance transporter